jgi:hypothetical protein
LPAPPARSPCEDRLVLETLARTVGFTFAAGLNLYATVAILGLASRFHWVRLPPQYAVFDNNWIIGAALVMYVVEFLADKIPWFDTVWDAVHTIIRPIGGALIGVASLGDASPELQVFGAILGGALASSSHLAKAGTRAVANTSPEPFSNWILSLSEDGIVVVIAALALNHPFAAAVVVFVAVILIGAALFWLVRVGRRRLSSLWRARLEARPDTSAPA